MVKVEPYRIQYMGEDCYLVCFNAHTGEHYKEKSGKASAESSHLLYFEIMVKRQDSIDAVVEKAKNKIKEILPLLSLG